MTLTLRNSIRCCLVLCCALFFGVTASVEAQSSLTLSVTPPLIQNIVEPGDIWKSQLKIVNPNPFELTVYIEKKIFVPAGEGGQGTFHDVAVDPSGGTTLPEWIDITTEAITVPREKSKVVEFVIDVPENAPPGGHFAAIQVGTQPPASEVQNVMQTSQVVTSLFFLQIKGDIREEGRVREFKTKDALSAVPSADFILRFENKGNVHIQPQGVIEIYNMWGKERGVIPINHNTQFGNVLPESIRKFNFAWEGESSIFDVGRYTAIATIGYGTQSKDFVSAETSFWVIPIKATLVTIFSIVALIWFVVFAIKLYVRRMLMLAGVAIDQPKERPAKMSKRAIIAPFLVAASELRKRLGAITAISDAFRVLREVVVHYRIFVAAVISFIVLFVIVVYYLADVTKQETNYEVRITEDNAVVVIDSEEVRKGQLEAESEEPIHNRSAVSTSSQLFVLDLVNTSGTPGLAAEAAVMLEQKDYLVDDLSTDRGRADARSVVVYDQGLENAALTLSQLLGGALLSARAPNENQIKPSITVFVGSDQRVEAR